MGRAETSPFQRARPDTLLERVVPVSAELRQYRPPTARRDVLAGVTVAALALPSAMAYGELAGLSPLAGLYTLLLPTVAHVLLGKQVLDNGGVTEEIGEKHLHPTVRAAVATSARPAG